MEINNLNYNNWATS
jgi:hypothetical protein